MATRRQAEKAIEAHADRLAVLPNVVGLGVQPLSDDRSSPARMALAVYVSRKVPSRELESDERVPTRVAIKVGSRKRYVPIRVIEQGEVSLEG